MTGLLDDPVAVATDMAVLLILIGAAFAALRLVLGPSLADRVVALDYLAVLLALLAALLAIRTEAVVFLDVTVVLSLMGFLATVAFARYVERRARVAPDRDEVRA